MQKIRLAVVIVAATATTVTACTSLSSGGSSGGGGGNSGASIGTGFGSKDASGDVAIGRNGHDALGSYFMLNFHNHSSGTSDYYVEWEIDKGSHQVTTGNELVQHLSPGGTATKKEEVLQSVPSGATIKLTQVERTASSS